MLSWFSLRRHTLLGFGPKALTRLTWHAADHTGSAKWTVENGNGASTLQAAKSRAALPAAAPLSTPPPSHTHASSAPAGPHRRRLDVLAERVDEGAVGGDLGLDVGDLRLVRVLELQLPAKRSGSGRPGQRACALCTKIQQLFMK